VRSLTTAQNLQRLFRLKMKGKSSVIGAKKTASVSRGRLVFWQGHRAAMSGRRSAPTLPFYFTPGR